MTDPKTIATKIIAALDSAISSTGQATLVVCGGSSPLGVFSELTRATIDWAKVTITLVDDRNVPCDHKDSNRALLKKHLLVENAAAASFMPLSREVEGLKRPFTVMLLGMGPDGHFASLFPAMVGDEVAFSTGASPRVIETGPMGNPELPRISMNMSMILESDMVMLIVNGAEKQAVLEKSNSDDSLPIHWLLAQTECKIEVEIL